MIDRFNLDSEITSFAGHLMPSRRRELMRAVANYLKRVNTRRMTAEEGPDGQPWEARRNPPKNGRPSKMMTGLKKNLKTMPGTGTAEIGFKGQAAKIATIHHRGLLAEVSPFGPKVQYEMRQLIGVTGGDLDEIGRIILENAKLT